MIVEWVNALLGPLVRAIAAGARLSPSGHEVIPPFLVMVMLIVARPDDFVAHRPLAPERREPRHAPDHVEDGVGAIVGLLEEWIGPTGRSYLPLIGTLGIFILCANYMGLVPGLMAPTSSINVTLGCAITIVGLLPLPRHQEQGIVSYIKHFWAPPGAPLVDRLPVCSRSRSSAIRRA